MTLGRSAFLGSQRFGSAIWSGDIKSTFEALRFSICSGLNMAISGIPWWTTDIGGFHSGEIESEYFRELIVRWFQYGTFCPIFRLHGVRLQKGKKNQRSSIQGELQTGEVDNEVWSFGENAYRIIKPYMLLRERMRPYISGLMQAASETGIAPMRPLFIDFPQDERAWEIEDQFMFGRDILVAPVYEHQSTSRSVYLPHNTRWKDIWSGKYSDGGHTVLVDAPLERIPVFVRSESDVRTHIDI